jgi:hypothetical protein
VSEKEQQKGKNGNNLLAFYGCAMGDNTHGGLSVEAVSLED